MKGHAISFLHSGMSKQLRHRRCTYACTVHCLGPQRAAQRLATNAVFPRIDGARSDLIVVFVSSKEGTYDKMAAAMLVPGTPVSVRIDVVYAWLHLLKAVHPLYKDITIDQSPKTIQELQKFQESVVAGSVRITDAKSCELNRLASMSTAEVSDVRGTTDKLNDIFAHAEADQHPVDPGQYHHRFTIDPSLLHMHL